MHNTENHILDSQGQLAWAAPFFVVSLIQFIGMFAGIGGFREGLTHAGDFVCVGHCEIDKYADRSYRALFDTEGEWFIEDARKADPSTMRMKVLIVEPGKYPREADIEHTLQAEQKIIGGTIQAVYPWRDRACIVCNDDGIALGLPLNRMLGDYDVIHGTFFICGLSHEDFADLAPQQIKHYEELYHDPQVFFLLNDTLCVDRVTPEEYDCLMEKQLDTFLRPKEGPER